MDFRTIPFIAAVTPPPVGGGSAAWEGVELFSGGSMNPGSGIILPKPAGTGATDLLIAIRRATNAGIVADMTVPAGWTLIGSAYASDFGNEGFVCYWAPGSVADGTWVQGSAYATNTRWDVHRFSGANLTTPIRDFTTYETPGWGSGSNMPSPSATAASGDAVLAHYRQLQSDTAVGAAATDFTRVVDEAPADGTGRVSTQARSNAPAGATGVITHNAAAAFEGRTSATIVVAAA